MIPVIDRARDRILNKVAPAISGSGGHAQLWQAAIIGHQYDLSEDEFLTASDPWNGSCLPPWSAQERVNVLRQANKNSKVQRGQFLRHDVWRPSHSAPRRTNSVSAAPQESDVKRKARQRAQWPEMRPPGPAEMEIIAATRPGISAEAVSRLNACEHLFITCHHGHECFVVRDGPDGTFAQARRMDGRPFDTTNGPKKSLNLPGSEGKWLCPGGLGGLNPVIIVEGIIGALEVMEMDLRAGIFDPIILAAVSASVWMESETLQALKGRRITILSDNDEAGKDAAARWAGQITAVTGSPPRVLAPPGHFKDFGECLPAIPRNSPFWKTIIS